MRTDELIGTSSRVGCTSKAPISFLRALGLRSSHNGNDRKGRGGRWKKGPPILRHASSKSAFEFITATMLSAFTFSSSALVVSPAHAVPMSVRRAGPSIMASPTTLSEAEAKAAWLAKLDAPAVQLLPGGSNAERHLLLPSRCFSHMRAPVVIACPLAVGCGCQGDEHDRRRGG